MTTTNTIKQKPHHPKIDKLINQLISEAIEIARKIEGKIEGVIWRSSALVKIVNDLVSLPFVLIDVSSVVLSEGDVFEVVVESSVELADVVVEFEGLGVEPVKLERLKREVVRVKPDFKPGKRSVVVRVSYEFDGERCNVEKAFEIEFKSVQVSKKPLKREEVDYGRTFGSYSLVELVGRGAFAYVYKALDKDGRVVAVKIYRGSEKVFIDEIGNLVQITRRLGNTPYIVKPIDYGVDPKPFVVMDFYPMTLRDLIGQDIELKKKLKLMHRVAKVLSYAHSKGIYHGDLKPENILVFEEGGEYYPAIADWGGGFTPGYSAPEVYKSGGRYVGEKSDVYSFGVILYELITGERLFSDPIDYIERCENVKIEVKDKKLEEIINSCLSREDLRPSMGEVAVKIANYLIVDLGTRCSMGLTARDAVEIISTYLDSGKIETAEKRMKAAEKLIPKETLIVIDRIIEFIKFVYEYKVREQIISAEAFEQKYRGIIDILDQETAKIVEQDKFSPRAFLALRDIPPNLHEPLLLCLYRMKDIIIARYIKE